MIPFVGPGDRLILKEVIDQPPPAPVEPPADDEVGDEPDIEGD